jgi:hypothetical protein
VHRIRILLAALVVVAILIVAFATGWADDKAKPGSKGRGTVTTTAP